MQMIRSPQMRAFRYAARNSYLLCIADKIRDAQGSTVAELTDEELHRRCNFALDRAVEAGLTWASSVYIYVSLAILLGPHFDRIPAITALLDGAPEERNAMAERLPSRMTPEVWEAAGCEPISGWEDVFAVTE
jgi:hypothetical protein